MTPKLPQSSAPFAALAIRQAPQVIEVRGSAK